MAHITRPLNTSVQLPPAPEHAQLVSPMSTRSPGGLGSPTPTPGAEQKQGFWSLPNSPDGETVFWAHGGTGNTPATEEKPTLFSSIQSPSKSNPLPHAWPEPPTGVPRQERKQSESSDRHDRKTGLLSPLTNMKGHKVSWSDSSWESDRSKGMSSQDADSSQSDASRPGSPFLKLDVRSAKTASTNDDVVVARGIRPRLVEYVDKRAVVLSKHLSQAPPQEPPFVVYSDTFPQILGPTPILEEILHDTRAPFFGGNGCFHRTTSTLFVTSALIKDSSPASVSSRNWNTVTTSLTMYSDNDITRDKVRFSENYMPSGICIWHPASASKIQTKSSDHNSHSHSSSGSNLSSTLVMCVRGTLSTPAGLMQVSPKRPHTVTPLVTQYPGGRALNSPHSVVTLSDGSLLFTDPPVGYEIGYRPRPQMPPLVHRFDPSTGDVRAVADGLIRPTCIAISPDERTVYIVDAPRPSRMPGRTAHFEDVLDACCAPMPTIQAYTLVGVTQGINPGGSGVFLTNKRLFAFPGLPSGQEPTGLAINSRGDVFVACGEGGVLVYTSDGILAGKIRVDSSQGQRIDGVCIGRRGELFAWGGSRVWRISLDATRIT